MPKVSVIIPTYNTAKYICEAIDSVFAQTYQDYEIIVIDDGSKDGTQKILSKYGNKIKYTYQDNKGVSMARNRGIREARGEYVAFLDADDSWFPDKLMRQVSIAEQNPDIDLIFSDTEVFNDRGLLRSSYRPSNIAQYEIGSFRYKITTAIFNDASIFKGNFYRDLLMGNLVAQSTVFIRKKCLDEIGYYDESFTMGAEDYDLWVRIAKSHSLLYLNSVTTRYRCMDESSSGKINLRGFFYQSLDVKVLEKQLRNCPKPYKDLIKRRILKCYKSAIWGYYNLQESKKVRTLCLHSLHLDKFQMKLYLYLLLTFFPPGFIKSRTPLGT